jgi:uncharacterized protein (DUF302 family)
MSPDGLTICASSYCAKEAIDRLADAMSHRGMSILARIDHAAAAAKAGMELRPTEVLIFGNPKAGTPLMQASQTMGIDLPLKALVFQDNEGKTWLAYNDPKWLARRHGIDAGATKVLEMMTAAIETVVKEATVQAGG